MTEAELQREIMKAVTAAGGRVFRNNTGQGWVGEQTTRGPIEGPIFGGRIITLRHPRPLHAGLCVGSSDLIGWYRGRFLAIEVKSRRGIVTEEQRNFLDEVNGNGGIGIIARSVDDVLDALANSL